jgi:phosphate:Na+ symporter
MEKIVPIVQEKFGALHEKKLQYLEGTLPRVPSVAGHYAHMEICRMGDIASENFSVATRAFFDRDKDMLKKAQDNEKVIDFLNHKITAKLAVIARTSLSPLEANKVGKMFIILSDIERIGDHAVNIADHTEKMMSNKRKFTPAAVEELTALTAAVEKLIASAIISYRNEDKASLDDFKAAAKKIDKQARRALKSHTQRLKNEDCEPENGIVFTAIVNDLQRTTAHAKNIALSVIAEQKWQKKA